MAEVRSDHKTRWIPVDKNPDTGRVNVWRKVQVGNRESPTNEQLPATNPSGEVTKVEGFPEPSPMYPTTNSPRKSVPMGGVPTGEDNG